MSTTVHDKVYTTLKRAIMCGRFRPGEFMVSRSLAVELGTSEMPVREAIKRLSTERAVEPTTLRKFRIPQLDNEKLKSIFAARVIIEGAAIALAAERRSGEDLVILKKLHESIRAEQNEQIRKKRKNAANSLNYMQLNENFHFTIYRLSGNMALIPLIESLWLQYMPAVAQHSDIILSTISIKELEEFNQAEYESHEKIYMAIVNQDATAARKALEADILPLEEIMELAGATVDIPKNTRHLVDYLQIS